MFGQRGPFPFAGLFIDTMNGPDVTVGWSGQVAGAFDPLVAWRASRAISHALTRAGPPQANRRRALSILWARLDGVRHEELGPMRGKDLAILLVARDDEGWAISGVGMGEVYLVDENQFRPWITGAHPLLCEPGLPARRPGALLIDELDGVLVGVRMGQPSPNGRCVADVLPRCGVHQ
jgi:hypothetical protein